MKIQGGKASIFITLALGDTLSGVAPPITGEESSQTRLGRLELGHGLPTAATRQTLYDEMDFQRAVQRVIWAEPTINNALFQ